MDVNNYNHIRNTRLYRFLRDWLGFSQEAAIRIGLFFFGTGMLLRNLFIALFVIIIVIGIIYGLQMLKEKSDEWNEQMRQRSQQERETYQQPSFQEELYYGQQNKRARYRNQYSTY